MKTFQAHGARIAMMLSLAAVAAVPVAAQQVQDSARVEQPALRLATAEPGSGPRVQPEMKRVQPALRDSTQTTNAYKKDTIVITATTLGLILILAILLVLL